MDSSVQTDGEGCSSALSGPHHLLPGVSGLKGGPPHYSHTLPSLPLPACTPTPPLSTHHPFIPPCSFTPASHHRSFLSSHTHPLSCCRLMDESTFDNGIRNWVSALSLDTIRAVLLHQKRMLDRQVPPCADMVIDNRPIGNDAL